MCVHMHIPEKRNVACSCITYICSIACRRVECTPPADMKLSILDNRGAGGWIRLSVQVKNAILCVFCPVDGHGPA
jgi:hypothetical protein